MGNPVAPGDNSRVQRRETRVGRGERAREWGSGARWSKKGPTPLNPMATPLRGIGVCPWVCPQILACSPALLLVPVFPTDWGLSPKAYASVLPPRARRSSRETRAQRRAREWGSGARRSKKGPTSLDPMATPPRGIGACPWACPKLLKIVSAQKTQM